MLAWAMDANGDPSGPQRHEFWATHPINAFHGAPLHLGIWMRESTLTPTYLLCP